MPRVTLPRNIHRAAVFAAIALAAQIVDVRAADSDASPTSSATLEISEAARKVYAESMRQARALLTQKKYDEAIATLDKLAAERPREPQARFLKAIALTDIVQVTLLVFGGLVVTFLTLGQVGAGHGVVAGFQTLVAKAPDHFQMILDRTGNAAYDKERYMNLPGSAC